MRVGRTPSQPLWDTRSNTESCSWEYQPEDVFLRRKEKYISMARKESTAYKASFRDVMGVARQVPFKGDWLADDNSTALNWLHEIDRSDFPIIRQMTSTREQLDELFELLVRENTTRYNFVNCGLVDVKYR